jgi:lipid II:glycine glycyltransferase (peptidoglycan interpeptide bridge formation enzyme)
MDNKVVAGVVLFRTPRVTKLQYSASSACGNAVGAPTALMDYAAEKSKHRNVRYFDFGTSNEDEGRVLNEGLYGFKTSFGAGGVTYEFYELDLDVGRLHEQGC